MLLTTNCTWTLTRIMVTRLVEALGEPCAVGGARVSHAGGDGEAQREVLSRRRARRLSRAAPGEHRARASPRGAHRSRGVAYARRSTTRRCARSCWRCPASGPTPPTTSCGCSATTATSGSTRGAAASSRSSTRASATSTRFAHRRYQPLRPLRRPRHVARPDPRLARRRRNQGLPLRNAFPRE